MSDLLEKFRDNIYKKPGKIPINTHKLLLSEDVNLSKYVAQHLASLGHENVDTLLGLDTSKYSTLVRRITFLMRRGYQLTSHGNCLGTFVLNKGDWYIELYIDKFLGESHFDDFMTLLHDFIDMDHSFDKRKKWGEDTFILPLHTFQINIGQEKRIIHPDVMPHWSDKPIVLELPREDVNVYTFKSSPYTRMVGSLRECVSVVNDFTSVISTKHRNHVKGTLFHEMQILPGR